MRKIRTFSSNGVKKCKIPLTRFTSNDIIILRGGDMIITDFISITELSRLTKKSRPTIYKYLNDFSRGNYDDIPYSIINLFKMAETSTKAEIIAYCNATYGTTYADNCNEEVQELINLIISKQKELDVSKIKDFIMGELNND